VWIAGNSEAEYGEVNGDCSNPGMPVIWKKDELKKERRRGRGQAFTDSSRF
jgi:hypothetical protein